MDEHDIYVPTQAQLPYLGAVLSYGNFEMQTAELRAKQANATFAQLRSVLRASSGLIARCAGSASIECVYGPHCSMGSWR